MAEIPSYRRRGRIERMREVIFLIKMRKEKVKQLVKRLKTCSYEVPEILVMDISGGPRKCQDDPKR